VLYLLHGSNDTAAGWTDVGKANFILDNLLAAKGAVPMLVVMPWGHAVPFDGPQTNNTELFERYLLDEIIPQVEHKYRVATDRRHRAIVGLSMGGGQALQIGFGHLELFSSIGAFSSAVPSDFGGRFQALLKKPDTTNRQLDVLWIGCGRQDSAFERNRSLSELLTQSNIRHTFHPTEGLHNFALWRRHLAEVAPLLFRGR
jgi:enterochelin esterase family protein